MNEIDLLQLVADEVRREEAVFYWVKSDNLWWGKLTPADLPSCSFVFFCEGLILRGKVGNITIFDGTFHIIPAQNQIVISEKDDLQGSVFLPETITSIYYDDKKWIMVVNQEEFPGTLHINHPDQPSTI